MREIYVCAKPIIVFHKSCINSVYGESPRGMGRNAHFFPCFFLLRRQWDRIGSILMGGFKCEVGEVTQGNVCCYKRWVWEGGRPAESEGSSRLRAHVKAFGLLSWSLRIPFSPANPRTFLWRRRNVTAERREREGGGARVRGRVRKEGGHGEAFPLWWCWLSVQHNPKPSWGYVVLEKKEDGEGDRDR